MELSEIKRRTEIVGIFPNELSIYRFVGALLLEQNDVRALQHRYLSLETLAEVGDNPNANLPPWQPEPLSCQTGDDDPPNVSSYTTPGG